jgi:hypothetical protein
MSKRPATWDSSLSEDKQHLLRAQIGADFKEHQEKIEQVELRVIKLEQAATRVAMAQDKIYRALSLRVKTLEAACIICIKEGDK